MMNRLNIVSPISPIETVTVLSSGRIIIVILAGLLFGLTFQLLLSSKLAYDLDSTEIGP